MCTWRTAKAWLKYAPAFVKCYVHISRLAQQGEPGMPWVTHILMSNWVSYSYRVSRILGTGQRNGMENSWRSNIYIAFYSMMQTSSHHSLAFFNLSESETKIDWIMWSVCTTQIWPWKPLRQKNIFLFYIIATQLSHKLYFILQNVA